MMKQIKEIPMTMKGEKLVKRLERAPIKAYQLATIAARGEPDSREKGLRAALGNLFSEKTLGAVPKTPVALAAAVNSANEVVAALARGIAEIISNPRIMLIMADLFFIISPGNLAGTR